MRFVPSKDDPEVFLKSNSHNDGRVNPEYYTYILIYVEDILIVDKNPLEFMTQLKTAYVVKEDSIEQPTCYLGSDIGQINLQDVGSVWTMSSDTYVKEAICNV